MDDSGTLMTQSFSPAPLVIRVGDTVTWRWAAVPVPHTVPFNSNGPPLADIVPGPNPGELTLGAGTFPTGPSGPNAAYDGTVQASSGIPEGEGATYSLRLTQPGAYEYLCLIHPTMKATVTVAAGG